MRLYFSLMLCLRTGVVSRNSTFGEIGCTHTKSACHTKSHRQLGHWPSTGAVRLPPAVAKMLPWKRGARRKPKRSLNRFSKASCRSILVIAAPSVGGDDPKLGFTDANPKNNDKPVDGRCQCTTTLRRRDRRTTRRRSVVIHCTSTLRRRYRKPHDDGASWYVARLPNFRGVRRFAYLPEILRDAGSNGLGASSGDAGLRRDLSVLGRSDIDIHFECGFVFDE